MSEDDSSPEIDEDEFADPGFDPAEIADQVEEEAGAPDPDTGQDDADGSGDAGDESGERDLVDDQELDVDDLEPEGDSWGDLYVGTLTSVSNAIIEEHGKDGAEPIGEDLARDLHIDEYANDVIAKMGKSENMPPEQALLVSSTIFMVTVLATKTDVPSKLLQEADLEL